MNEKITTAKKERLTGKLVVLLYYKFIQVADPTYEVFLHKKVCQSIGLKGRILIAGEGINGTVCGTRRQVDEYIRFCNGHQFFSGIVFKESRAVDQPFPKMIIKERPEIVALRHKVNLKNTGKYIKPEELHSMLERGEDIVMIDMRNNYEYTVGRFANAIQPDTKRFHELPNKVKEMTELKDKKIVTYCTGGIRCEKASALLVEEGFSDVGQLEGGIVKYLEKYPDGHFIGKNFVFDGRMTTNGDTVSGKQVLAKCEHCGAPCDEYHDCTKPDCHQLFIGCDECVHKYDGLCPVAVADLVKAKS